MHIFRLLKYRYIFISIAITIDIAIAITILDFSTITKKKQSKITKIYLPATGL
jgi:hypothetical protein